MYFRFGAGILLIVAVSVTGIAIDKSTMDVRRDITQQHFRMEVLRDEQGKLRLQTQQLRSPKRMIESIEAGDLAVRRPPHSARNVSQKSKRRR